MAQEATSTANAVGDAAAAAGEEEDVADEGSIQPSADSSELKTAAPMFEANPRFLNSDQVA